MALPGWAKGKQNLSDKSRARDFYLALQLGLKLDLHVTPESVRDRAKLLGLTGGVLERFLVYAGYLTPHIEVHGRDLELLVVQSAHGVHLEPLRRRILPGQSVGECHRVARG